MVREIKDGYGTLYSGDDERTLPTMAVPPKRFRDDAGLRLKSIPPELARLFPFGTGRRYRRTECLSLILKSKTVGEYRRLRAKAGFGDDYGG
jgi:hypothetical protein